MKTYTRLFLIGCLTLVGITAWAQTNTYNPLQEAPRKKVGLVLSGGGAKGVAHIGVLKVLEELDIPIDYIAGTSMGSIVGGLYAIGFSPQDLDSIMRAQSWMDLLTGRMSRNQLFFTEKEDSDRALITIPFDRKRFYVSTGILSGWSVSNMLNEFTLPYQNMETFNDLPIPFACVAYDVIKGEEYVMNKGSLPMSIRASMSIPGAFSTVEMDGKALIDGGVINNFPVDVVRSMGAEVVIGVDVSFLTEQSEKSKTDPADVNNVSYILSRLLGRMGREKFDKNLSQTDLLIVPNISEFSSASFSKQAVDTLLHRGEVAGRAKIKELIDLRDRVIFTKNGKTVGYASPPNRTAGARLPVPEKISLNIIYFEGLSSLRERNLERMLHFKEHSEVTPNDLATSLIRLKGTGLFSHINYRLDPQEDHTYNLVFECKERSRSSFSVGVRFNSYDVAAGYLGATITSQYLKGWTINVASRLSTNPYVQAGVYYQDAWIGRFGISDRYRFANLKLHHLGDTVSYNVRFHLNRLNLEAVNFYHNNFNFYLTGSYEQYIPTTYALHQGTLDYNMAKENLIVYRLGTSYDSWDNLYYPSEGTKFKAHIAYYTNDFVRYKNQVGMTSLSGSVHSAFPVADRLTMVVGGDARFLFGKEFVTPYQNILGGAIPSHYADHQVAFVGENQLAVVDNKLLVASFETRYRLGELHYIWFKVNAARTSHSVLDLIEWSKGSALLGGAIGYSFDTPIGPLDVMVDYGTKRKSVGVFVNFGKHF